MITIIILAWILINTWSCLVIITLDKEFRWDELAEIFVCSIISPFVFLGTQAIIRKIIKKIKSRRNK